MMDTTHTWSASMRADDEQLVQSIEACIHEAAKAVGPETMLAVFAGYREWHEEAALVAA